MTFHPEISCGENTDWVLVTSTSTIAIVDECVLLRDRRAVDKAWKLEPAKTWGIQKTFRASRKEQRFQVARPHQNHRFSWPSLDTTARTKLGRLLHQIREAIDKQQPFRVRRHFARPKPISPVAFFDRAEQRNPQLQARAVPASAIGEITRTHDASPSAIAAVQSVVTPVTNAGATLKADDIAQGPENRPAPPLHRPARTSTQFIRRSKECRKGNSQQSRILKRHRRLRLISKHAKKTEEGRENQNPDSGTARRRRAAKRHCRPERWLAGLPTPNSSPLPSPPASDKKGFWPRSYESPLCLRTKPDPPQASRALRSQNPPGSLSTPAPAPHPTLPAQVPTGRGTSARMS